MIFEKGKKTREREREGENTETELSREFSFVICKGTRLDNREVNWLYIRNKIRKFNVCVIKSRNRVTRPLHLTPYWVWRAWEPIFMIMLEKRVSLIKKRPCSYRILALVFKGEGKKGKWSAGVDEKLIPHHPQGWCKNGQSDFNARRRVVLQYCPDVFHFLFPSPFPFYFYFPSICIQYSFPLFHILFALVEKSALWRSGNSRIKHFGIAASCDRLRKYLTFKRERGSGWINENDV